MRLLIFGPNGSGKGTQSSRLVDALKLTHVESGQIFRDHAKRGTELGKEAKTYTDKGELVPDVITIPMIISRLSEDDCKSGFILDGFPRNPSQAEALLNGLSKAGTPLDAVVEIQLNRDVAKMRLMGRCTCPNGHPNNTAIAAICPKKNNNHLFCWSCGAPVTVRGDDIDESAIEVRLNIYFDVENGTMGAINWLRGKAQSESYFFVSVPGAGTIDEVSQHIQGGLHAGAS